MKDSARYMILGLVVVVVVLLIIYLEAQRPQMPQSSTSGNDFQGSTPINSSDNIPGSTQAGSTGNDIPQGNYLKAPEFSGIASWINSPSLTMKSLHGKVVLVDFWAYSCVNCIRTFPHLTSWYSKYNSSGLVIVGVHTPEFNFEKDHNNVLFATQKYGITYPVALDNDYLTWTAYQNSYWPREYLIDKNGNIRYDHIGEGNYDETEKQIQKLLAETGQNMTDNKPLNLVDTTPTTDNTPELYIGYNFAHPRGQNLGNPEGIIIYKTINYTMPNTPVISPDSVKPDTIYAEGLWTSNPDNLITASNDASSIYLSFIAKNANIVAASNTSAMVEVLLDGKDMASDVAGSDVTYSGGKAYMKIDEPRLYDIYDGAYGRHLLQLIVMHQGFSYNSFTFG